MRALLLIAAFTALPAVVAGAAVKVDRITYHGWPGAYRLSNGTVDLVVVPQIGRIMRYGFVGGPNALWENPAERGKTVDPARSREWTNFGGDKLWPAPQARWSWPPDPYLDAGRCAVKVLPGGRLQLTGQASPKAGLRFRREIALDAAGTGVTMRNTLENTGGKPVEWSVWQITQVDNPEEARLPLNPRGHFPKGYYTFAGSPPLPDQVDVGADAVVLRRHPQTPGKIGSDSPLGWASATVSAGVITVSAPYVTGTRYPDDGCAEEIWSNADPLDYMELELLGPLRTIRSGSSTTLTTHWTLKRA